MRISHYNFASLRFVPGFCALIVMGAGACARPVPMEGPYPDRGVDEETRAPEKEPGKDVSKAVWHIGYAEGELTYDFKTDAQVAMIDSSTQEGEDDADFRSVPSSFNSAILGISNGEVVVLDPPEPESRNCDEVRSLITRAKNALPVLRSIPEEVTVGSRWSDSVTSTGCRGNIPMKSTAVRNYEVVGDTANDTSVLLIIRRTEVIEASGEGSEDQHRIFIDAKGGSVGTLYFDVNAGVFTQILTTQTTRVNITASGRTSNFLQKVSEVIALRDT